MLKSVADEAWPWAVPEVTLKDLFVRHSKFMVSLAKACLPKLKILSMREELSPILMSICLMCDLDTESKPASMSV